MFAISEIIFQIYKRMESPFVESNVYISLEEFQKRISVGEQLVILDDLVLDVSKFKHNHPGGTFVV